MYYVLSSGNLKKYYKKEGQHSLSLFQIATTDRVLVLLFFQEKLVMYALHFKTKLMPRFRYA